jgi:UDP-glucuronate 4-epimerase
MKSHILIAGTKGYVGKHLVHQLSGHEGITSVGLSREGSEYSLAIHHIDGSYEKVWQGKLQDIFKPLTELNLKAIVNLVADISKNPKTADISKLIDSNCTFAVILADLATRLDIERYVYISTYSTHMEKLNFSPQTLYAASKKAAEDMLAFYAQSKSLKVAILKPYDIYGPFQPHARLIPTIMRNVLSNSKFELFGGDQEICPIYIDDVLSGIKHAIWRVQLEKFEVACLPGPEIFKVKELPRVMTEYLGGHWDPGNLIVSKEYRENEIMRFTQPNKTLPDWIPLVNLESGVKKMQREEFFE